MTPAIAAMLAAIWYHAGTMGSFVASINQATTNCVDPPKIVTPSA